MGNQLPGGRAVGCGPGVVGRGRRPARSGDNQVEIKVMASGLCHTDDHHVTGDFPATLPLVGGHEGVGIVTRVAGTSPRRRGRPCCLRPHGQLRRLPLLQRRPVVPL